MSIHPMLGLIAVRVKDPKGLRLEMDGGTIVHHKSGRVLFLPADLAKRLFEDGRVSIEEMRPSGAPAHVERREA